MKRLIKRNRGGCIMLVVIIALAIFLLVRWQIKENRKSDYIPAEVATRTITPVPTPTIKLLPVPLDKDEKLWGRVTLPQGQLLRSTPYFDSDNVVMTIPYGAVVEVIGESEDGKWAFVIWLDEDEDVDDGERTDFVDSWQGFMHFDHLKLEYSDVFPEED